MFRFSAFCNFLSPARNVSTSEENLNYITSQKRAIQSESVFCKGAAGPQNVFNRNVMHLEKQRAWLHANVQIWLLESTQRIANF